MRSRAPTGTTKYKTQSQQKLPQAEASSKPQGEYSHSPRGSGATVGYHKKGYPKQEPKILLIACKNQSQRTTTRSWPILRFVRGLRRGLSRKAKALRPTETLSPRPRPARPQTGCQFFDSPEAGLSNNLVTSTPTGSSDKTSSRQELSRANSCQNLRESPRTLPEAQGLLSDTIKRGTLSKNRKDSLGRVYINAKGQRWGLG